MADEKRISRALTFPTGASDLLAQNANIPLSPAVLTAVSRGEIVWKFGCVRRLVYFTNSKDLDGFQFDSGEFISAPNMNDFKASIESSIDFNHALGFCQNEETREISMLWLYRCGCDCRQDG